MAVAVGRVVAIGEGALREGEYIGTRSNDNSIISSKVPKSGEYIQE